jgi:regulator of protease activity HflC (stomatin/prohibitin superfamily)
MFCELFFLIALDNLKLNQMNLLIPAGVLLLILIASFISVQQGTIAVVTMFGKYRRILTPGLNFRIPVLEKIFSRVSIQNRAIEMEFQAITQDQANVYCKAMLVYAVLNADEDTVKNVAFKFMDQRSFSQALIRTIEGSVRGFVATKKQAEILLLRREIVDDVKNSMDVTLETWGFHLIDLQLNDITFDTEITASMAKVVASNNLKAAAENEGQALLITKTKAAEADGNAIKIAAHAEKEAAQLKGQGIALFREEVARGMSEAAEKMREAKLDTSLILFSMWTEAVKEFAEKGQGNVIFLDGSVDGMQKTIHQMMANDMLKK